MVADGRMARDVKAREDTVRPPKAATERNMVVEVNAVALKRNVSALAGTPREEVAEIFMMTERGRKKGKKNEERAGLIWTTMQDCDVHVRRRFLDHTRERRTDLRRIYAKAKNPAAAEHHKGPSFACLSSGCSIISFSTFAISC